MRKLLDIRVKRHTCLYAVGVFYVLQRLEAVIIASQIFFDFAVYIMFLLIAQQTCENIFFFGIADNTVIFYAGLGGGGI